MEALFQRAAVDQTPEVLAVLDEAASWLHSRGISQWPSPFEPSWVEESISRGETWLVLLGERVGGTVTLDWSDPLWSDVVVAGGDAGYVHRMAVRRWAAGLGTVMLRWAADAVRARDRSALRLDCVASNRRLRAYYEAAGFLHRGDVPAGGPPGHRTDVSPVITISRYELLLV